MTKSLLTKFAATLALLACAITVHAQAAYAGWGDVKAGPTAHIAAAKPVTATPTPTLPRVGTLTASYTGKATATFGYTEQIPSTNRYPTYLNGTAVANGTANITAVANAAGATLSGTLSGWTPGALINSSDPKDFNQKAVAILPASMSFTGTLTANSVSYLYKGMSNSKIPETSYGNGTVGAHSRGDYMPDTLTGSIGAGNARPFQVGGTTYLSNVQYTWTTTRH